MEVQKQLQCATEEMEQSTVVIKHLSEEKALYKRRIKELADMVKDLKSQVKEGHQRSQVLQDAVNHADRIMEQKTRDVSICRKDMGRDEELTTFSTTSC